VIGSGLAFLLIGLVLVLQGTRHDHTPLFLLGLLSLLAFILLWYQAGMFA